MKQRHKGVKLLNPLLAATCMVLANASHAFANTTPGPLATPSMFALIILLTVLTFAGGGYVVFGRLDEAKYPSKGKRRTMKRAGDHRRRCIVHYWDRNRDLRHSGPFYLHDRTGFPDAEMGTGS